MGTSYTNKIKRSLREADLIALDQAIAKKEAEVVSAGYGSATRLKAEAELFGMAKKKAELKKKLKRRKKSGKSKKAVWF